MQVSKSYFSDLNDVNLGEDTFQRLDWCGCGERDPDDNFVKCFLVERTCLVIKVFGLCFFTCLSSLTWIPCVAGESWADHLTPGNGLPFRPWITLALVRWTEAVGHTAWVPKPKPPTRNRRLLLVFDNVFEVDISAVFKNNCLRGNIYIRLSFVFSMFSIQSQHFLVDSDAPPPFLCYRKHHQTAMEQRLQRFCLLTFHPSSIFLTHFS